MIFLLYGANGWIGKQLLGILKSKNYKIIYGQSRVDNKEELENEIKNISPTHIISLIGRTSGNYNNKAYTNVDYLELPGKIQDNIRDNLFGPVVLALLCKKYNIHLTYVGTGCIFEYDEKHPYGLEINGFREEDKPNFFGSSYSIVKGYTDELMHLFEDIVLNVRIRMPITIDKNPRNFITKIASYKKICSVPNSMSILPELLPIMVDMIIKKITGTINLVNPGLISHNEILEMYRDIIDPTLKWDNYSIEEQNKILLAKRSNTYLDTTKLINMYPNVKNIKQSIKDVLLEMKQNIIK